MRGVSNHQPHDCLLNHLLKARSKNTWKLLVTGLCVGNSPVTSEFLAQRASNTQNVPIWWRHHDVPWTYLNGLERCGCNSRSLVFLNPFYCFKIDLSWMQKNPIGDRSTLVQVMAWCHQATSHYRNRMFILQNTNNRHLIPHPLWYLLWFEVLINVLPE